MTITFEQLLTDPKYREMTVEQLKDVLESDEVSLPLYVGLTFNKNDKSPEEYLYNKLHELNDCNPNEIKIV